MYLYSTILQYRGTQTPADGVLGNMEHLSFIQIRIENLDCFLKSSVFYAQASHHRQPPSIAPNKLSLSPPHPHCPARPPL